MKKIKTFFNKIWLGLGVGLKTTEDKFFHQNGVDEDLGVTINQQVEKHSVCADLLKGELTQEVKDLRWRTYAVEQESENYEYFSPTMAKRKNADYHKEESSRIKYENSEDANILLVQPIILKQIPLNDELFSAKNTVKSKDEFGNEYTTFKVGEKVYDKDIKVKRDFTPKFKIERYLNKLILKQDKTDDNKFYLDLYVTKYSNGEDITSRAFLKEIKQILDTGYKTDIVDIQEIEFISNKALNKKDMLKFVLNHLSFTKVVEYDGNYVIKYNCDIKENGSDLTDQYYSERLAKKYEKKEPRKTTIDIDLSQKIQTFICDGCGKEVTYALDEDDCDSDEKLEYTDLQMTEQTFGKRLCKECLEKNLEKLYMEHKGGANQYTRNS